MPFPISPRRLAFLLLYAHWLAGVSTASAAGPASLRIKGNGTDLAETPVFVEAKASLAPGDYVLQPDGGGAPVSASVVSVEGKPWIGLVLDRIGKEETKTYRVREAGRDSTREGVRLTKTEGENVRVDLADKPFLEYRLDLGTKPVYFPVIGPTGDRITRAYPMEKVEGEDRDHNHQRSMWFTHGNVNGVDFWASDPLNPPKANYGTIKETSRPVQAGGTAFGLLVTTDDWLGPDGKTILQDRRLVRFWKTTSARILDFDVTLKAANGPVQFGDTKEGMFGLRVASSMDVTHKPGGKIVNAEGIADAAAWGKASPWVDYSGPVGGKTVGVAILNHPESFRYPTTWHVRDYGLFAANPFGWHDFGRSERGDYTLPAGESISFRYRVVLHAGDASSANLPASFRGYAEPPKVEWPAE